MSTAVRTRVDHLEIARNYARHFALHPSQWPLEPQFDPDSRWYACLANDADAQIWLLTWLPGQGTDLHDHGGSAGAFVVVSGAITEKTVSTGRGGSEVGQDVVAAGHGRRFGSHHVHQMTNNGRTPAMSIHVYGPALETMNRYELAGRQLRYVATDRAGVTW
jgi:predicted metal-dependent enzyme (double-stranded beta helix superfamily)